MKHKLRLLLAGLLFLWLCFPALAAQDTPEKENDNQLELLLKEREQLIKEYKYYNSQNSNFWGKKSKKDLLNIIGTLKRIIEKDSEIVRVINTQSIKKQAEVSVGSERLEKQLQGDKYAISERIHDLNRQVENLQNLNKSRQRQIQALEEQLKNVGESRFERDRITVFLALLTLAAVAYAVYLHMKFRRYARYRKPRS